MLTNFTVSNGIAKTPRDNLCGILCGANNSCRTPRIAKQFSKVQIYFDMQKALLRQSFLCCMAVPWCRRFLMMNICGGSKPPPYKGGSICKNSAVLFHLGRFCDIIYSNQHIKQILLFSFTLAVGIIKSQ